VRSGSPDIDTIWQNTKAKHEIQDQRLVEESTSTMSGFEVRQAIYEAERKGQALVYHDYFLFSEALQIELSRNGTQQAYQRCAPALETLAHSVRELPKPEQ